MTVTITFENVLTPAGEQIYKLKKVVGCMSKEQLPTRYIDGGNYFYKTVETCINSDEWKSWITVRSETRSPYGTHKQEIVIGSLVSTEMKDWIIESCKKAGEALHEINLHDWDGKVVKYYF